MLSKHFQDGEGWKQICWLGSCLSGDGRQDRLEEGDSSSLFHNSLGEMTQKKVGLRQAARILGIRSPYLLGLPWVRMGREKQGRL